MSQFLDSDPIAAALENVDDGKRIGQYVLQYVIQQGTRGSMYRGRSMADGVDVDVILLDPEYMSQHPNVQEWFVYQAGLAQQLDHANLLRVLESGVDQDVAFIAVDATDCDTLLSVVGAGGAQPLNAVLDIGLAVTSALAASHQAGLYLCGVRPDRLLVFGDNTVQLAGPGIPDIEAPDLPETIRANFWSPEECAGQADLDARVDIYATGVLLFYATTGALPADGEDASQIAAQIRQGTVRDPAEYVPDIPEPLAELIVRSMAVNRDDRPADAATFYAELKTIYDTYGAENMPPYVLSVPVAAEQPDTGAPGFDVPLSQTDDGFVQDAMFADTADYAQQPADGVPNYDQQGAESFSGQGEAGSVYDGQTEPYVEPQYSEPQTADAYAAQSQSSPQYMTAAQLGRAYESGGVGTSENYTEWYNRTKSARSSGLSGKTFLVVSLMLLALLGGGGYLFYNQYWLPRQKKATDAGDSQANAEKTKNGKPKTGASLEVQINRLLAKGKRDQADTLIRGKLPYQDDPKQKEKYVEILKQIAVKKLYHAYTTDPSAVVSLAEEIGRDPLLKDDKKISVRVKMLLSRYYAAVTFKNKLALGLGKEALTESEKLDPVLHIRAVINFANLVQAQLQAKYTPAEMLVEPNLAASRKLLEKHLDSSEWRLADVEEKVLRAELLYLADQPEKAAEVLKDINIHAVKLEPELNGLLFSLDIKARLLTAAVERKNGSGGDPKMVNAELASLSSTFEPVQYLVPDIADYDRLVIDADDPLAAEANRIVTGLTAFKNVYATMHAVGVFDQKMRTGPIDGLEKELAGMMAAIGSVTFENYFLPDFRTFLKDEVVNGLKVAVDIAEKTVADPDADPDVRDAAAVRTLALISLPIFKTEEALKAIPDAVKLKALQARVTALKRKADQANPKQPDYAGFLNTVQAFQHELDRVYELKKMDIRSYTKFALTSYLIYRRVNVTRANEIMQGVKEKITQRQKAKDVLADAALSDFYEFYAGDLKSSIAACARYDKSKPGDPSDIIAKLDKLFAKLDVKDYANQARFCSMAVQSANTAVEVKPTAENRRLCIHANKMLVKSLLTNVDPRIGADSNEDIAIRDFVKSLMDAKTAGVISERDVALEYMGIVGYLAPKVATDTVWINQAIDDLTAKAIALAKSDKTTDPKWLIDTWMNRLQLLRRIGDTQNAAKETVQLVSFIDAATVEKGEKKVYKLKLALPLLKDIKPDTPAADRIAMRAQALALFEDINQPDIQPDYVDIAAQQAFDVVLNGTPKDNAAIHDLVSKAVPVADKLIAGGLTAVRQRRGMLKLADMVVRFQAEQFSENPVEAETELSAVLADINEPAAKDNRDAIIPDCVKLLNKLAKSAASQDELKSVAQHALNAALNFAGKTGDAQNMAEVEAEQLRLRAEILMKEALAEKDSASRISKLENVRELFAQSLAKGGKLTGTDYPTCLTLLADDHYRKAKTADDLNAVLKLLNEAESLWKPLREEKTPDSARNLVTINGLKARVYQRLKNTDAARNELKSAMATGNALKAELLELSKNAEAVRNNRDHLIVLTQEAVQVWTTLVTLRIPNARMVLITLYDIQARAYQAADKLAQAEVSLKRIISVATKIYTQERRDSRKYIAVYYRKLGDVQLARNRKDNAKTSFSTALKYAKALKMKDEVTAIQTRLDALK